MSNQEQQTKLDGGASVSTVGLGAFIAQEVVEREHGRGELLDIATIKKVAEELARMRGVIDEVHAWAVCACIATPEDMAQDLPRIIEITAPNVEVTGAARHERITKP